jgi:hypothetical protein
MTTGRPRRVVTDCQAAMRTPSSGVRPTNSPPLMPVGRCTELGVRVLGFGETGASAGTTRVKGPGAAGDGSGGSAGMPCGVMIETLPAQAGAVRCERPRPALRPSGSGWPVISPAPASQWLRAPGEFRGRSSRSGLGFCLTWAMTVASGVGSSKGSLPVSIS